VIHKTGAIPWFQPTFWGNEKSYVLDALESSWLSEGGYVDKFENLLTRALKTQQAITVCNGTAALHLALLTEAIGSGDEVIVPGFTFAAPVNMTLATGATPVYVDIDPNTWCISPDEILKAITPRTKAIIPVHLYGNVCNMEEILNIGASFKISVIEDVAESFMSQYKGQYAGTFGAFGCYSFQATKTITTGEGGAICTDDNHKAEKARIIRNHGMTKERRYWHHEVGHNFRLTNLQSALGFSQLEKIQDIIQNKKRVYDAYLENLSEVKGISFQRFEKEVDPVVWAVALRVDPKFFKGDRDYLIKALSEVGIETRPGFSPFHEMPIYKCPPLKNVTDVSRTLLSLPSYPSLSNEDIYYISEQVKLLRK